MQKKNILFAFLFLIALCLILWYFLQKPQATEPEPVEQTSTQTTNPKDCLADPTWFPHTSTQEPDADKFQSTSNCVFHQWSWQTFLWLTQEVNNQPRFMTFTNPLQLIGMKPDGFTPRMSKSHDPETFNEFLQAGSDAILVDHNGRPVYYSQYLDTDFVKFIEDNKLTDPNIVKNFDATKSFPNGATELKATWKIVRSGEDASQFFTTRTLVNKLKNQDGNIVISPDETEEVTVALVGFHIAGVVEGHPEMIWATFEHKSNAPNVPQNVTPDTVISPTSSTFYTANTAYKECNVNVANTPNQKLDEATQTLTPITQVCRQYQYGNDPESPLDRKDKMAQNDHNIAQLNTSVLSKLNPNDVWSNYYQVGAIWFGAIDGLKPNMALDTDELLTGSLKLSNATIETFTQSQSAVNNCFRCHNTKQIFPPSNDLNPLPGLNINISHAFVNIYFWSQEKLNAGNNIQENATGVAQ